MKPYCKYCKYYLKYVERVKRDGSGDDDICGQSLRTYIDEVGVEKFETYGDIQHCDECGAVNEDGRKVVYQKCLKKNAKFKCTHFDPKWYMIPLFITRFIKSRLAKS